MGTHETLRDQWRLMRLRETTGNSRDNWRLMRFRDTTGGSRDTERLIGTHETQRLNETNGNS